MNPRQFFTRRAIGLLAVLVIAGLVAAFYCLNNYIYEEKQGDGNNFEPYRATLSGKYVCLPHVDTSGPQTDECAAGLQTDVGEYYAIDFALMSQTLPPEMRVGVSFNASGVIVPLENISSDQWQQYPIEGIFSVTDSVEIDFGDAPTQPPPSLKESATGECYVGGCSAQLCSSQPDLASDCMYREEYACFQTAVCERQPSGMCGWTETPELTACLSAAGDQTE